MKIQRKRIFSWARPTAAAALMLAAGVAVGQSGSNLTDRDINDLLQNKSFDTGTNPIGGGPAGVQFPNPSQIDAASVRRTLDDYSRSANSLYVALDGQTRVIPALRTVLADMIKIRARATLLAQRIMSTADVSNNAAELKQLDSDWRLLAYRLNGIRELDRNSVLLVSQLDKTNETLSRQLQSGPSVDYRSLVQQTGGLVTAIDRLIEDIEYEIGQSAQARELIIQGQAVRTQAAHLAEFAFAQTDYNTLVRDFKLFQQAWSPFSAKLRNVNSRWLERDSQRVSQIEREINALLYVPATIDREQLLSLTKNLERDVDDFFSRAPLKMLMRLPNSELALPSADEFYGVFENFIDNVNRGENHDSLVDAFGYIQGSWQNFARVYRPLNSSDAQQVLTAIEKDVQTLSAALLIQEGFDRTKAAGLAATINNLAQHLERDTQNWLNKARPPYQSQAQREVALFVNNSRELHEAINSNMNLREVRQMSDALFENWRRVYSYVIQCQTSERPYLASTSSQTTPALVELRTILSK